MTTKQKLLDCGLVHDNEFLDKYIDLINTKSVEVKQVGMHNRHHIVPRFYFRKNNLPIDNSTENIANLTFKDHILAHYYLALCSTEKYRLFSELAFFRTSGFMTLPTSEEAMGDMPKFDKVYRSYIEDHTKRLIGHPTSDETKRKISIKNTGKRRTPEERKRIADATRAATTPEMRKKNSEFHKGSIWVNNGTHSKQVRPEQVNQFLANGWMRGRVKFSGQALATMKEANIKIAQNIKGKVRYVTDGISQKYIFSHQVEEFLASNPGWRLGQTSKPQFIGCKFMNNGVETRKIKACDIDNYLAKGWKIGHLKKGL